VLSLITTKLAGGIEMLLAEYLTQRGVKELALTHAEAKILGLAWPLVKGWTSRFGQIRLDDDQLHSMRAVLKIKRAKGQTDFFQITDGDAVARHVPRAQIAFGTTVGSNYQPAACKCLPWDDCACGAQVATVNEKN